MEELKERIDNFLDGKKKSVEEKYFIIKSLERDYLDEIIGIEEAETEEFEDLIGEEETEDAEDVILPNEAAPKVNKTPKVAEKPKIDKK